MKEIVPFPMWEHTGTTPVTTPTPMDSIHGEKNHNSDSTGGLGKALNR